MLFGSAWTPRTSLANGAGQTLSSSGRSPTHTRGVYDLLVAMPDGIKRVQVKTTTFNKNGWLVRVGRRSHSVGNRGPLVPYDPDLIDLFFILDGDLTMHVIPSRVIAGRVAILLHNYSEYVVGSAAFLIKGASPAA